MAVIELSLEQLNILFKDQKTFTGQYLPTYKKITEILGTTNYLDILTHVDKYYNDWINAIKTEATLKQKTKHLRALYDKLKSDETYGLTDVSCKHFIEKFINSSQIPDIQGSLVIERETIDDHDDHHANNMSSDEESDFSQDEETTNVHNNKEIQILLQEKNNQIKALKSIISKYHSLIEMMCDHINPLSAPQIAKTIFKMCTSNP